MMNTPTVEKILKILKKEIKKWKVPAVGVIAEQAVDRPFDTLISTILSLRTKDMVTEEASYRLLKKASTPKKMVKLPVPTISKLIYPVGFLQDQGKKH